jgi:hypothetical protein
MAGYNKVYKINEDYSESIVRFYFISNGQIDIIKVIEYSYVREFRGVPLYNLGFGDYDLKSDIIDDVVNTNNGDHYMVFNTVLFTIPIFFRYKPNSIIMVQGSDNSEDFSKDCKITCKKKCTVAECKNLDRRIKAYRHYVNKNYNNLLEEYEFWGSFKKPEGQVTIESYEIGMEYDSVFCKIKKNNFVT